MKKKIDFITNSSSSSFILPSTIKDTKTVAKQMVDIIFKEWKEFDSLDEDFKKQIYNNIKELDKNENIMIPFSCNYETFIHRLENGNIFVDTCHNHDWERTMDIIEHFNPDVYNEQEDKKMSEMTFVDIETGERNTKENHINNILKKLNERDIEE